MNMGKCKKNNGKGHAWRGHGSERECIHCHIKPANSFPHGGNWKDNKER